MKWQKDHAVNASKAAEMSPEELADKFTIGVLADRDLPIYMDQYERIISRAQAKRND